MIAGEDHDSFQSSAKMGTAAEEQENDHGSDPQTAEKERMCGKQQKCDPVETCEAELDKRVAERDLCSAVVTLSTESDPADHRNLVEAA